MRGSKRIRSSDIATERVPEQCKGVKASSSAPNFEAVDKPALAGIDC